MELSYLTDGLGVYGAGAVQALEGLRALRKTTLRVNTLKAGMEETEEELSRAGIPFERAGGFTFALKLAHGSEPELRKLSCYQTGRIYLQSLSSMLPPLFLGAQAGEDILDMAAAPGGKTSELCQLTGGGAFITACEINPIRAQRLRANLELLGCRRVTVMQQDARKLDDFLRFDRILLDAPCSGSGTFDLNDESSCAAFSRKLVLNSAKLQRELVKKAVRLLKPGGTLLYSTCSLLEEENAQSAREAEKLGLVPEPIDMTPFADVKLLKGSMQGTVTVCPDENYEGFFMARFKKKG